MAWLFFSLSALCGILAVHPFALYPLTLMVLKRLRPSPLRLSAEPQIPSFAICVCAYNEEAVIRSKAENLMALKRVMPSLEVKIYVDAAQDGTAAILSEYADEFDIHVAMERHGKTHGMNLLVAKCTAPIVIFSDANVLLDVATIPNLANYFSDPEVGCVCGHLKYVNAGDGATAATGSLFWRLTEKIKQLESDTGSAVAADGSIFAIRRALHRPPPDDIIDDMFVSLNILCDGYRIVRAADVIAYEKSVTSGSEEFTRKARIACQAFNVHRLLWPRLRMLPALNFYKYMSHKVIRWFTILWLVLSALFFELFLARLDHGVTGLVLLVLAGLALWLGAKFKLPLCPQLADILSSFAGAGLGVWKSLHGERYQTWAPAQSIRRES